MASLLNEHADTLARVADDPKLKRLPEYLTLLSDSLVEEQTQADAELRNLTEKVQHIKNIISAQQNYTRRICFKESIDVHSLVEDLLAMHGPSILKNRVSVVREFAALPWITVEKSKLLQVLDNLIKNALEAMAITERESHILLISTKNEGRQVIISIGDTGHGITDEQLKSIFRFGFTTKPNGNGFGLHSAAIAMNEMGGAIRVASGGSAQGATFSISLPFNSGIGAEPAAGRPAAAHHTDAATFVNECA